MTKPRDRISFLVFLLTLILSDVEVSQLIDITVLVGSNYTKPIPHVVLFQVLLSQVFQIPEQGGKFIYQRWEEAQLRGIV